MTAITNSSGTTGLTFTTSDTLTLASDGYVIATDGDAITLDGNSQTYELEVDGTLLGAANSAHAAIWVMETVTATITIGDTGSIRGDVALWVDGDASITNHGSIVSSTGDFAIFFTDASTGTHTVENSGVITGSVAIDGSQDDIELVTNTGVINGQVNLAGGNDIVHNERGTINGSINLDEGDDEFYGGLSGMFIYGGAGRDKITGGTHSDVIDGGADTDTLRGAGGKDLFSFNDVAESGLKAGKRDIIADFKRGQDQIGLSEIDAIVGGVDEEFTLLARGTATSAVGSGKIGFYWEDNAGKANDRTIIRINNDADAKIEMTIELSGLHKLQDSDFVL